MAQFGHISTRGRAALLILATSATVLGAGAMRSLTPAAAAGATSVTLTTTTPQVVTGHAASLKAVVHGSGTPTGTVTFFEDGQQVLPASQGTKSLGAGKNSVNVNFTMNTPGAHQFTATYNGGGGFAASSSTPVTVNVGAAGTGIATVSVSSSIGNTVPSGTPLVLTATLGGSPLPTGTVSFTNGSLSLGSPRTIGSNGQASLSVASLPLGANTITASYSGNPTYAPATGSVTITITETPADHYLIDLYKDLFGTVDSNGEAYWASQINKNLLPRYNVAYGFTQSTQYMSSLVQMFYTNIMQRPADPGGLASWTAALAHGMSPEAFAASLVASPERFANPSFGNSDVDTYIAAVYQAILGRPADPQGAAYWHDFLLGGGPRWQMTLDFVSGPEWATKTVTRLYTQFHLGTPDATGLSYWVGQLLHGTSDYQLAATLASSNQYFTWTQSN